MKAIDAGNDSMFSLAGSDGLFFEIIEANNMLLVDGGVASLIDVHWTGFPSYQK